MTASDKIIVKKLEKTCFAAPSRWEGETDDGKYIYIRYRWGFLRVDVDGNTVFERFHGEPLDGFMELGELIELTKGNITFDLESYGER